MKDSENFQLVREALEDRDYQTWFDLMDGRGITRKITEENFDQFVEMHELFLEGKTDKAKVIKDELGIGMRVRARRGAGRGVRDGMRNGPKDGRGMGRGFNQ